MSIFDLVEANFLYNVTTYTIIMLLQVENLSFNNFEKLNDTFAQEMYFYCNQSQGRGPTTYKFEIVCLYYI